MFQDHLARIEHQLDRTTSLVELVAVEQRRQALVTESLLSAISNLQSSSYHRPTASYRNLPSFNLSGLPINSSWSEGNSGPSQADFHSLAHAVNQCCHMLTQLQRDLAGVQQSLESNPHLPPEGAIGGAADRVPDVQLHNPFREQPKSTRSSGGSSYECNMDRFDPQVTLNNRVPPGTRTNNYWDNFRSYSRQNLLSSGPSNVTSDQQVNGLPDIHLMHGLQVGRNPPSAETGTRPRSELHQPPRRTKRKVNKGQRQMEIGVHCPPHADNRALAYGLSVRRDGSGTSNRSAVSEVNPIGRNLNREFAAANDGSTASATVPEISGSSSNGNNSKVAKDTSTLKYSGARPKENRRPPELNTSTSSSNVNLLAERESQDKAQGLESVIRVALTEHASRPHFLTQLLDLLHKFDSDPLRQMALNALQDCVADSHPPHPSELVKIFDSVVGQHRELTPQLLESFLVAIQLPEEIDQDEVEGATAAAGAVGPTAHSQQDENLVFLIRHALTPFLFRRLNEVHSEIRNTLAKFEATSSHHSREVATAAASTSGREDDLAEADQSCDQSCDGIMDASTPAAGPDEEEASASQRHSAVGLDEVPTRLMAILAPPVWSSSSTTRSQARSPVASDEAVRNGFNNNNNSQANVVARQRSEPEWFQEDA